MYGQTTDSNDDLIPSSIKPFRLGHGKENAFTDAVRMLQYVKHNADRYNIDKDHIVLAAGAAGGDITNWLAMAPEVATVTSDPVELESINVYAACSNNTISNWLTWNPIKTDLSNNWAPVPTGKTVFDMSGSVYVDQGEWLAETSGANYVSGHYQSETLYELPDHLKYSLGILFGNAIPLAVTLGAQLGGLSSIEVSSFHDWATIPGMLADYQNREAPLLTK